MKRITERSLVKQAIRNFIANWGDGTYTSDKSGRLRGKELSLLDPEVATAIEVDNIIGNTSWTLAFCRECSCHTRDAVDFDDGEFCLCSNCVEKALELLKVNQ